MKKSEINFTIELDENHIPEKIFWNATDKPDDVPSETKSISISLWDHDQQNTMRIDLWSKDMPASDMEKFYVNCLGGLGQSVLNSIGDEFMAKEINNLCDRLLEHIKTKNKPS